MLNRYKRDKALFLLEVFLLGGFLTELYLCPVFKCHWLNQLTKVRYSDLKSFKNRTGLGHLNTELVYYSDPPQSGFQMLAQLENGPEIEQLPIKFTAKYSNDLNTGHPKSGFI